MVAFNTKVSVDLLRYVDARLRAYDAVAKLLSCQHSIMRLAGLVTVGQGY